MLLHIPGTAALSAFRIDKLLNKCVQNNLPIRTLSANFIHFVAADQKLSDSEQALLRDLLQE